MYPSNIHVSVFSWQSKHGDVAINTPEDASLSAAGWSLMRPAEVRGRSIFTDIFKRYPKHHDDTRWMNKKCIAHIDHCLGDYGFRGYLRTSMRCVIFITISHALKPRNGASEITLQNMTLLRYHWSSINFTKIYIYGYFVKCTKCYPPHWTHPQFHFHESWKHLAARS